MCLCRIYYVNNLVSKPSYNFFVYESLELRLHTEILNCYLICNNVR